MQVNLTWFVEPPAVGDTNYSSKKTKNQCCRSHEERTLEPLKVSQPLELIQANEKNHR